MLLETILVCLYAGKYKKYNLLQLFSSPVFYPVLIVQVLTVIAEISIFTDSVFFLPLASVLEPATILSFFPAIFVYRLYSPAVAGSVCVAVGSGLNRFVISQNGGKMPVFPTLSYLTGYITPELLGEADQLHVLGNSLTRFKILTDFIDYGYCILSIGDLFIHFYFCLMLYFLIRSACTVKSRE